MGVADAITSILIHFISKLIMQMPAMVGIIMSKAELWTIIVCGWSKVVSSSSYGQMSWPQYYNAIAP